MCLLPCKAGDPLASRGSPARLEWRFPPLGGCASSRGPRAAKACLVTSSMSAWTPKCCCFTCCLRRQKQVSTVFAETAALPFLKGPAVQAGVASGKLASWLLLLLREQHVQALSCVSDHAAFHTTCGWVTGKGGVGAVRLPCEGF